jgi:hypothetical protein
MTRIVFLFPYVVVKIPNFTKTYQLFIKGILSNVEERTLYRDFKNFSYGLLLCPTYYQFAGFICIQKRARPISQEAFEQLDEATLTEKYGITDLKAENFGIIHDRIVVIDYGDATYRMGVKIT